MAPPNRFVFGRPTPPSGKAPASTLPPPVSAVESFEEDEMRTVRLLLLGLVALGATTTLSGCYTEYAVRPATCNAVWVPAHRGYWGRWHPGHWRCV
jgi:hypothetical protein